MVTPWPRTRPNKTSSSPIREKTTNPSQPPIPRAGSPPSATTSPPITGWQNPHFVGRRDELRRLHEQLGTGAVGVVTAVHGLGGQGKTELAVAYAHSFADCYPAGHWSLGAEGKTELLPLIGELAWERALDFTPSEAEKADPALLGRGVLAHLKAKADAERATDPDHGAAALLLLDNVSEAALLSPAQLATLPGGMGAGWLRLVATTRLDLPGAARRYTESLAIAEGLDASDPANAEWQRDLSVSLNKLGDLAVAQGDLPGAARRYTDALAIAEHAASDPANAAWQRDLTVSHNKLGELAVAQGDLPGAARRFTDALTIAERLAASDPANAEWQRDLYVSHVKFYQVAQKNGDEAGADAALRACFAVLERMKQRGMHLDPQSAQIHGQLAKAFGE